MMVSWKSAPAVTATSVPHVRSGFLELHYEGATNEVLVTWPVVSISISAPLLHCLNAGDPVIVCDILQLTPLFLHLPVFLTLVLSQIKCDQYWPSRGTETYGMTQVTLLDTIELATFCVRTFSLHKVRLFFFDQSHKGADKYSE